MKVTRRLIKEFLYDEKGATAVEYAILAGFIAAVVAGSVVLLGEQVEAFFATFVNLFPGE